MSAHVSQLRTELATCDYWFECSCGHVSSKLVSLRDVMREWAEHTAEKDTYTAELHLRGLQ